ncbi:MAG: FHA domain-containing protein [Planctomycetota bacterium]|nr:MAG: FHA domain-containing protein [Planctomycetota bacterium]
MKCASCGYTKNDPGQRTCNLCGNVLKAAPEPPPDSVHALPGASSGFRARGARKKIEQKGDGPSDDEIVYAGDFAIVYAFHLDSGGLLVLKPGEVFTFGRGDSCDHTIDSKVVSRRHARIHWQGTDPPVPEITDLDSRNGICVNGVPVKRRLLEDGDEVSIGPLNATLRVLAANAPLESQLQVDRLSATTVIQQRLTGEVKLISVPWLLGHLERIKESGTLHVHHEQEAGFVALISGVVIAARFGEVEGEEAVRKLAKMKQGRFTFTPQANVAPQNIGKTIGEILGSGAGPRRGGPGPRRPPGGRGGPPQRTGARPRRGPPPPPPRRRPPPR